MNQSQSCTMLAEVVALSPKIPRENPPFLPAEPEDDLDIMLGNKKKKKKNVKFPDEDEILEKDEGNIGSLAHF